MSSKLNQKAERPGTSRESAFSRACESAVIVRDDAEADIAQAALRYERQSAGLGTEFVAAVDDCFALVSQQPEAFPVVYRSARVGLLRKFPYLVVYRVFPDFISVVAVIHGRRHPRR